MKDKKLHVYKISHNYDDSLKYLHFRDGFIVNLMINPKLFPTKNIQKRNRKFPLKKKKIFFF